MKIENLCLTAKTVIISMNPGSGASHPGQIVDQLEQSLVSKGFRVRVLTDFREVQGQVSRLQESGQLRAVVAAGGDGTVSLLVNGLPADVPLAILPLGTENLLAKYLGMTPEPEKLAGLIEAGIVTRLDAGSANGKLFLVMASCGFDADVVKRLHSNRKGNIRHWSYAGPIFQAMGQYRYPDIRIRFDDESETVVAKWAFVFNVPRYALNLPIVEQADSCDGFLDLVIFRGGSLIRGLYYLFQLLTGQHRRKKSRFRRFRAVTIESDEPVSYQLDGDPGGELPLQIVVQPARLKVVVGKDWLITNRC
jgi:diacylglycerol kinase (ATP)